MSIETTQILVDQVEPDGNTQARLNLSDDAIDQYWKTITDGHINELPACDVFFDGSKYWIGDGWQRYEAHKKAGIKTLYVRLRRGTERDARIFACGANKKHGVRMTLADRRNAVEILLRDPECVAWSNSKIAEHCNIDDHRVAKIRKELFEPGDPGSEVPNLGNGEAAEPAKRVGKDGKSYPARKLKPKDGPSASKRESAATDGDTAAPPAAERAKKSGREKVTAAERKKVHATFKALARQLDDLKWMVDVEQEMAAIAEKLKDRWG